MRSSDDAIKVLEPNRNEQAMATYLTIYNDYWRYVLFICVKICGNKEDGEEVMQDVFLKVFKNMDQLQDQSKLKPWIAKIAARECYRRVKKNSNLPQTADLDEVSPNKLVEFDENFLPEAYLQNKQLRQDVLDTIDSLSEKQKEVTYLYYYADMKCEEIAALQKCSVDSVWNVLHTARKNIKRKIEKDNKGEMLAKGFVSLNLVLTAEQAVFAAQPGTVIAAAGTLTGLTKVLYGAKIVTYTVAAVKTAVATSVAVISTVMLLESAPATSDTVAQPLKHIYEQIQEEHADATIIEIHCLSELEARLIELHSQGADMDNIVVILILNNDDDDNDDDYYDYDDDHDDGA